jgi:hypothetical protein
MTTIAAQFSTKEIAADRMISGDGLQYAVIKLKKRKSSFIGAAGEWHQILEFYRRLSTKKPLDNDFDIVAIELRNTGIWVYENSIIPMKIEQDFYAIGTGSGYAMAAMHLGKSPREAVEIAALYDPGTRGPIDVLKLGSGRGKKNI